MTNYYLAGLVSYTEYLFLLTILTSKYIGNSNWPIIELIELLRESDKCLCAGAEPHTGFHIAFKMLDIDGNQHVDKKEFLKVCFSKCVWMLFRTLYLYFTSHCFVLNHGEHTVQRHVFEISECTFKCSTVNIFNATSMILPQVLKMDNGVAWRWGKAALLVVILHLFVAFLHVENESESLEQEQVYSRPRLVHCMVPHSSSPCLSVMWPFVSCIICIARCPQTLAVKTRWCRTFHFLMVLSFLKLKKIIGKSKVRLAKDDMEVSILVSLLMELWRSHNFTSEWFEMIMMMFWVLWNVYRQWRTKRLWTQHCRLISLGRMETINCSILISAGRNYSL